LDIRDLHNVLDAVLDGVILVDPSGQILHVNAEASRILEISSEKAAGSRLEGLFGPSHPVSDLNRQVRHERRSAVAADVSIERRFDNDVVVDVVVSPVGIEQSSNAGYVIELRDHTLRSSLRERQSQREQLQRFGHIAAGIAHEVKNPLGGIRGAAELLRSWSDEERPQRAAELIIHEVDRISGLVDQLMVFARGDQLKLAPVNVHQILDDVLALLAMDPLSNEIPVHRLYDPSIPELHADRDRMTQVFLNLARNALQAMEESGGELQVRTRMALEDRITRPDGRPIPTVIIEVSDTGPGIPPEVLGRLATPFFTTRQGGSGLGLAVARQWVTRHDGSLRVSSEIGQGATARVILPLHGPDTERDPDRRTT
jgi:two-component system nitrogen regulation sensor histidine kinase GlnL